jgi:hypothetical protein
MDLSRRQVLGLGAVAFGALRLPSPAFARNTPATTGPELFELALDDHSAHAATTTWRTSAVIDAPRRFDLVGLRWRGRSTLQAQVRTRRHGGRWTEWFPLPPSHGAGVPGTDPAFRGAADELQPRMRGAARHLRLRFVRALPHAPRAHAARERDRPRARASQTGSPPIVPRAWWGGDQVRPRARPLYGTVQAAFVHHTAGTIDYAPEDSPGIVLGIARYHRDYNGWNDIGYNFLVDRYGTIFEGREGGIEAAVVGAQAQGYNDQSTGIAVLGTFSARPIDEAALDALARLIGWKLSLHGVPVEGAVTLISTGGAANRYSRGTPVTVERVCGHRDGDTTTCPGDALYAQLPEVRARAAAYAVPISAITVRAARQRGRRPTTVSGYLRFADGSSPAGAPLSVEYTTAGGAWTPIAATTAALDGYWAATVTLPASGHVRAVFAGDATRPRVESTPTAARVVPSMALTMDKRRAKHGRTFDLRGVMDPPQRRVTCVLERHVSRGRWIRVHRKRVRVRPDGSFLARLRPRRAGLYRVSIVADGVTRRRTFRAIH